MANDFKMVNLGILNQFFFWRADLEFRVQVVKTPYHSGRLKVVIAYGAPSIETGHDNVYLNEVLDFKGENGSASFTIPYNAAT